MSQSPGYRIVAGVDGSPASRAALRWALWHAGLVDGTITVVMAWDYPAIYDWEVPGPGDATHHTARALTQEINDVAGDNSPIELHKEIAQGHPAKALLECVKETQADLLVVGNRGHGGFTEALLGSVSQYCVHHATCPVVVVREPKT